MKRSFSSSGGGNDIAQSRVIEHHLRENPIYARSTAHEPLPPPPPQPAHPDHCSSLRHHHQHHRHQPGSSAAPAHSYEKLDHVIINPTSAAANPAYNLLTVATPTVTSPDVVNTMGYLVASPAAPCAGDQLARPIIIWAPRSRDNVADQLNVVTDHHGRQQCSCNSVSGLPSTATSGAGYMECDNSRTRNNAVGAEEARERHHVTGGAESRDARHDGHHWLPRDQCTNHARCGGRNAALPGQYTSMSHRLDRLNDWNISAL